MKKQHDWTFLLPKSSLTLLLLHVSNFNHFPCFLSVESLNSQRSMDTLLKAFHFSTDHHTGIALRTRPWLPRNWTKLDSIIIRWKFHYQLTDFQENSIDLQIKIFFLSLKPNGGTKLALNEQDSCILIFREWKSSLEPKGYLFSFLYCLLFLLNMILSLNAKVQRQHVAKETLLSWLYCFWWIDCRCCLLLMIMNQFVIGWFSKHDSKWV